MRVRQLGGLEGLLLEATAACVGDSCASINCTCNNTPVGGRTSHTGLNGVSLEASSVQAKESAPRPASTSWEVKVRINTTIKISEMDMRAMWPF